MRTSRLQILGTAALLAGLTAVGFGTALAAPENFSTVLSGPAESPPNASPATGTSTVTIDAVAHTMRVQASFSGLLGNTTASHIHGATAVAGTGTAGVATVTPTFTAFPLGVTSGTYDRTYDMTLTTSYNPSYVTAHGGNTTQAEADLFQAIRDGKAYLNVHTNVFPGGEIRGFLTPAAVPTEAATWSRLKALYLP